MSIERPATRPRDRARKRREPSRFDEAKAVPEARPLRDRIRAFATALAEGLDRRRPLTEQELVKAGRTVLGELALDEAYLGFAMIMVNNAFWLDQFQAAPFTRRMLLLPRCLRHISGDNGGGSAASADTADIFHIRTRAEQLGYTTLVADGTPIVVKTLAEEGMDAILGVACLDSLETAFEKVRHLGVPAMAVPLLNGNCRDTTVELDHVAALLERSDPAQPQPTRSYLPLFREAYRLFEEPELSWVIDVASGGDDGRISRLLADAATLARDWLLRGGKRLRPFVTLAGYRALAPDGEIPGDIRRVAVAIEAFHKASLVHDDIEDDDATRYGLPTLHRQIGVAAAINVGDYLLGMGYRMVASVGKQFGAEKAGILVRLMSDAHLRLAQGQGAELAWRRMREVDLSLSDVLKIYALKTAPAFEAALASGMLLGDANGNHTDLVRRFCRYVGVGFQVLNDLQDWESDLTHHRPTVLPVLIPAGAESRDSPALRALRSRREPTADEVQVVGEEFEEKGVFEAARNLVERFRDRAFGLADEARPEALGDLLLFLTEVILRRQTGPADSRCRARADE